MGIINITPDSFYDGGKTFSEKEILKQAEKMLSEGATFLDVGGYSTRPGAEDISDTEEIRRVVEAIESILKRFPGTRSEEHTSELQSRENLVCRLLLEKKN